MYKIGHYRIIATEIAHLVQLKLVVDSYCLF